MEYYIQLQQLLNLKPVLTRWNGLYHHFIQIIEEQMDKQTIVGHTLFSQISYLSKKNKWAVELTNAIHLLRLKNKSIDEFNPPTLEDIQLGQFVISQLIQQESNIKIPDSLICSNPFEHHQFKKPIGKFVIDRRLLLSKAKEDDIYIASDEESLNSGIELNLKYINLSDQHVLHELFLIERIDTIIVHVHNIHIEDDVWFPKMIVIQPDYLIDITSISECFKPEGIYADTYLLRKLYSSPKTHYLLIGNIANFFLDEIIKKPSIKLIELKQKMFQLFPLDWIQYDDNQVRDIIATIRSHFNHLKEVVNIDFADLNIALQNIFLEPSFYSNKYGIQGRLDIFYKDNEQNEAKIIELKSGSAFKPNAYGLSSNHYAQTLLYDLLIKSVFEFVKPMNYILYSKLKHEKLKFAPVVKDQQRKAMRIRNQIILIEYQLSELHAEGDLGPITGLNPKTFPIQYGFVTRDLKSFFSSIQTATDLDLAYYRAFVGFISREQHLSKLGLPGRNKRRGLSALWLDEVKEKKEQYEIITGLTFEKTIDEEDQPIIKMSRSNGADQLANFRIGDIAVLYPNNNGKKSVLRNQIFKCTILELNEGYVILRFRNSQLLLDYLQRESEWFLEHDILDSNYNNMYRGLHQFLSSKSYYKELIYGIRSPIIKSKDNANIGIDEFKQLSSLQRRIMNDMINCSDYYLLWGPPGTGKTSIMLRMFATYLYKKTDERILLLAYTNRAVDEICDAMSIAGLEQDFIRIGSKYSSSSNYKDRLLSKICQSTETRHMLTNELNKTRIYISTVASIQGKSELLQTIPFDTVIIDEASQILESGLVGLLQYFKRFVLIGDHHQLPAVVRQSSHQSKINDIRLHEVGLHQLDVSLFERLIKNAQNKDWSHAYGQLTHQGRMHEQIMHLASEMFYNQQLQIVPTIKRLTHSFKNNHTESDELSRKLFNERCIFIPSQKDSRSVTGKTNQYEAKITLKILEILQPLLTKYCPDQNIGIITPYRAQIALITNLINNVLINHKNVSIDTVERYQGSARDIIILSLCTNRIEQLNMIGSDNKDEINKKFNVALTRAKEKIVVIGDPEILKKDIYYNLYMERAAEINLQV